jgi:hypothetical protein
MPRTSLVDSDKAKAAVSVLIWAPGITVREAMILVKFTEEEANTNRDLQKKTESKGKADATVATADFVPPVEDVDFKERISPRRVIDDGGGVEAKKALTQCKAEAGEAGGGTAGKGKIQSGA